MRIQVINQPMPDYNALLYRVQSQLAPGHQMQLRVEPGTLDSESFQVKVYLVIDGDRIPIFTKFFSQDDLADSYEKAHHEHHGYDPRGLDPRTERTRLKP